MAIFFSSENGDAAMVPPVGSLSPLGRGSLRRADYTQAAGAALSKRMVLPLPG
jgi:hypothetical protein